MADAELWLEIFNAVYPRCMYYEDGVYFYEAGTFTAPMDDDDARDLLAINALRWLGDRGWRTLFIESDSIKIGYAPDGGICDLSITGPIAQTLCEAIKRQLEREDNDN